MKRVWLLLLALPVLAGEAELRRAFLNKQVQVRLDMPGTQQGVDLYLDRDEPMDWKQHSSRIKSNGVSIRRDDRVTVTGIVVKKNLIEFQLDGGGYGTAGDDTSTYVTPVTIYKSEFEKRLERDLRDERNPDVRRRIERDLSRERGIRQRREREERARAEELSIIKRREIMARRERGGSRFNLRQVGAGTVDVTPELLMQWLKEYVVFADAPARVMAPSAVSAAPALRRGMTLEELTQMMGPGKLLSETEGDGALKTQQWEFMRRDFRANVTAVDGLVVRYTLDRRE